MNKKNISRSFFGWIEKINANLEKKIIPITEEPSDGFNKNVVAEVTKSTNCMWNLKKGEKIIFTSKGLLLSEESTACLCLWAIVHLAAYCNLIYSYIYNDINPSAMCFCSVKCASDGWDCRGSSEVLFKIYCAGNLCKY